MSARTLAVRRPLVSKQISAKTKSEPHGLHCVQLPTQDILKAHPLLTQTLLDFLGLELSTVRSHPDLCFALEYSPPK